MNILILHSSSDLYGASNILLLIIRNLTRNGYRVTVVLSEPGPLADKLEELQTDVRIIRLGILRRRYFSPAGLLNRIRVIFAACKSLEILAKEKNIKLIYSNTTGVLAGALTAKKLKLKHIWHVHEIILKPLFFVRIIGFMLNRYSDQVICVSDAVKDHWQKYADPKKLNRIYNGIDPAPFQKGSSSVRAGLNIPKDSVLIGMIGRVHYWKGQDYFLRIAGELSRRHRHLRFLMAGDAFPGYEYLYENLKEIIREENLAGKVTDLGYCKNIIPVLNAMDIFILPSVLPDPFPTVILEAMAAGKPVVATAQGGAVEMIETGESGLLIPVGDVNAAATVIEPLIQDSLLRNKMGQKANERLKTHFSSEAFNNKIISAIKHMMDTF